MDEANALFMARRVMRRNLERAKDAQSICDNDLLRSIILETTMWLHDFDVAEPAQSYQDAKGQLTSIEWREMTEGKWLLPEDAHPPTDAGEA